jgi:hypothetical protein
MMLQLVVQAGCLSGQQAGCKYCCQACQFVLSLTGQHGLLLLLLLADD